MPTHIANAFDVEKLLNFEAGVQPLQRKKPKTYRPDIDFHVVDNIANEIADFHRHYKWGYPITLVQRGERDSGDKDEVEAISLLNEMYGAIGIRAKTQMLSRYVEITGVGYTFIDVNSDWQEGDSFFDVEVLDPRYTFVVRSSRYVDHRPMVAVSFRKDDNGNHYYTCYTKDAVYELDETMTIVNGQPTGESVWTHTGYSGVINPLHRIPIVEWVRDYDRMGCFERQISAMNDLNLLLSDISNQVDQQTQCVWHTNDVEFPTEEVTQTTTDEDGNEVTTTVENPVTPKSGEWVNTYTSPDGKTPFIKPLLLDYDYAGQLSNYKTRRELILQKCGIPMRNNTSGGSSGVAMDSASGWSHAESAAMAQQNIMESLKMEEIKCVLAAIKASPHVPADSPLLKLQYVAIQPNIRRNKTYELATKANAFATLVAHGYHGLHAMKIANMDDDVNQAYADSKELIDKYQKSLFERSSSNSPVGGYKEGSPDRERTMQDNSDHVDQSPNMSANV